MHIDWLEYSEFFCLVISAERKLFESPSTVRFPPTQAKSVLSYAIDRFRVQRMTKQYKPLAKIAAGSSHTCQKVLTRTVTREKMENIEQQSVISRQSKKDDLGKTVLFLPVRNL